MKNHILIVALAAALTVGGGLYVSASTLPDMDEAIAGEEMAGDFHPDPGEIRQGRHLALMSEVLNLSAEQKEQIEGILERSGTENADLRRQLHEDRQNLRALMRAGTFDEATLRAQAESAAKKRIDLLVARAKVKSEIIALLTPEQQDKVKNLWDLMAPRRHGKGPRH